MDDREAIRRLKYRYCYALNGSDLDGVVGLFTEDARFETPAAERDDYPHGFRSDAAVGRDEIRGVFETITRTFESTAHLAVNPLIEVSGDDATGAWYYLAVLNTGDGVEWAQGRYDDEYRRVDGEWRIASCRVRRHAALGGP